MKKAAALKRCECKHQRNMHAGIYGEKACAIAGCGCLEFHEQLLLFTEPKRAALPDSNRAPQHKTSWTKRDKTLNKFSA
jgi:hypothetical protein